jgi:hypothetical protein
MMDTVNAEMEDIRSKIGIMSTSKKNSYNWEMNCYGPIISHAIRNQMMQNLSTNTEGESRLLSDEKSLDKAKIT